jgi:hypothetical protein
LSAESGVGMGVEAWVEVKAAVDARELVRLTDAGLEVEARHGIGDGDEVGSGTGGQAFGREEECIGERVLEGAERRAMDGVDDDGDTSAAGGESADEAGFSAVGMDDVRGGEAEPAGEIEEGVEIEPGMDGADEGRDNFKAGVGDERFERAFGA